jgi:hydroxyethylthiazole kinase
MMGKVTGTGCAATAIIGAFLAVDENPVRAAAIGLSVFGIAGEISGSRFASPGSFMIGLLDALYEITPEMLEAKCRITEG